MFGLSTSQGYRNGEIGVEENPQWIMLRNVDITIFNSQGLWLGFSLKSTLQHMWVMGVYIVWVDIVCIRYDRLAKQNILRVSRWKALPARHNQLSPSYPDSSHSNHVLGTYFTSWESFSRATRKIFFALHFALSVHTHTLSLSLSYTTLTRNPT